MSIDNKVNEPSNLGGFLKSSFYTIPLYFLLSLLPLKDIKPQEDPIFKDVHIEVQLFKSDSSAFHQYSAGVNIWGNDLNDSTKRIGIVADFVDSSGYVEFDINILTQSPTDVELVSSGIPDGYRLYHNFPEPFNPHTTIRFDTPEPGHAYLKVYDLTGELVFQDEDYVSSGTYDFDVDLSTKASGVYFAHLSINNINGIEKLMMVRNKDGYHQSYTSNNASGKIENDYNGFESYYAKSNSKVMGDDIFTKLQVEWAVNGFGTGRVWHDLWIWNDTTGMYEFQNTIIDTFHLPYPSSAPGMKVDPENKSTLTVNKDYFNTSPEINFQYKSDAKKE